MDTSGAGFRGSLGHTPLAGLHEVDEVKEFRARREFPFEPSDGVGDGEPVPEQDAVGLPKASDRLGIESRALEPNQVGLHRFCGVTGDQHEGSDIPPDRCAGGNHGEAANTGELMDGRHASQDCMVLDHHMSSNLSQVGHDDMITEVAVVGDVGVGEQIVVDPTTVAPPSAVAAWMVTYSRNVFLSPISTRV